MPSEKALAPSFRLDGMVALITGGSRGIGLAIAEAYASVGADIIIASRKLERCTARAEDIARKTGVRTCALPLHVGHWEEAGDLVEAVYGSMGSCDILVNCAGMSPLYDSPTAITETYFDKVIGVNLKGPLRLATLIGERMAGGKGGSIINISTIAALRPTRHELVYAAAKAGLNALTVGLAEAYAPNVRCNAIMPGEVLTDISKHWSPEHLAEVAGHSLLGRGAVAQDIAGTAIWLASPASAWVTGTLTRVDGGHFRQV